MDTIVAVYAICDTSIRMVHVDAAGQIRHSDIGRDVSSNTAFAFKHMGNVMIFLEAFKSPHLFRIDGDIMYGVSPDGARIEQPDHIRLNCTFGFVVGYVEKQSHANVYMHTDGKLSRKLTIFADYSWSYDMYRPTIYVFDWSNRSMFCQYEPWRDTGRVVRSKKAQGMGVTQWFSDGVDSFYDARPISLRGNIGLYCTQSQGKIMLCNVVNGLIIYKKYLGFMPYRSKIIHAADNVIAVYYLTEDVENCILFNTADDTEYRLSLFCPR